MKNLDKFFLEEMENMHRETLLDSIKKLLQQNNLVIEAQLSDFKKETRTQMEQIFNEIKDIKDQLAVQKSQLDVQRVQITELQNRQRNGLKSNFKIIKEF